MDGRGKPSTYTSRQVLEYPYLILHCYKSYNGLLSTPLVYILKVVFLCVGYIFCDEGTVKIRNSAFSKCQAILCFSDAPKPQYQKRGCDQKVITLMFLPLLLMHIHFPWPAEERRWSSGHVNYQQSSAAETSLPSQVLPSVLTQSADVQMVSTHVSHHHCISEGMQLSQTKWRSLS